MMRGKHECLSSRRQVLNSFPRLQAPGEAERHRVPLESTAAPEAPFVTVKPLTDIWSHACESHTEVSDCHPNQLNSDIRKRMERGKRLLPIGRDQKPA